MKADAVPGRCERQCAITAQRQCLGVHHWGERTRDPRSNGSEQWLECHESRHCCTCAGSFPSCFGNSENPYPRQWVAAFFNTRCRNWGAKESRTRGAGSTTTLVLGGNKRQLRDSHQEDTAEISARSVGFALPPIKSSTPVSCRIFARRRAYSIPGQ